ncbi:MAG: thioredoxin domain-containing protein [Polyangiaceae bacterium]
MTRAAFAIDWGTQVTPGARQRREYSANGRQTLEIGKETGKSRDPPSKTGQDETTLGPAMFSLRLAGAALGFALFNSQLTTCRSPGEGGSEPAPAHTEAKEITLTGVDTSALTGREKADWSRYVSDLLAPCPDQPVSLAQCVSENRACKQCLPAANFLVKQVRRGRARAQIETAFRGRFSPDMVKNIELEDSPAKGPAGAPVLIVEFADFECPACGAARPLLDELYKTYEGQMRFVFKNVPLSIHQYAEKAARAGVAAHKQNKFWEMHAVLFDNQQHLEQPNVELLAKSIGLDMPRFLADRDSEAVADFVARDRKQGERLELSSTPTMFINGRKFESSGEFKEDLDDWVQLEIKLAGGTPAPHVAGAPAATPAASASAAPAPSGKAAVKEAKPKGTL